MKTQRYKYDMSGLDNVWLVNGFTIEETPYGNTVHIDDLRGLDLAIAKELIFKTPNLSGKAIRFLRQLSGLSQPDLAHMLEKDTQTVARWEKSGRTTKSIELLARMIFAGLFDGNLQIQNVVATLNAIDHAKHAQNIIVKESKGMWQATHEALNA